MKTVTVVLLCHLRWRDAAFAWRIASEPSVRAMSFDPRPPTLWRHFAWMWRNLRTRHDRAWVVEDTGGWRVGVATLRRRRFAWYIGVAILPEARGRGYATAAVRAATYCAPVGHAVFAEIKADNHASLRLFHGAGYGQDWRTKEGHWLLTHPAP